MTYNIKLPAFEGPLDLLLHLIKKNEIDIYDIPIAEITGQYLSYIEMMKSLNLDIAGEFLLMASTLIHIKSRLLLPAPEPPDDVEDPRNELVRQLVEYQSVKEAAFNLDRREILDRDVYKRIPQTDEDAGEAKYQDMGDVTVFDLISALKRVLSELSEEKMHEVIGERISISDKIAQVLEELADSENISFYDLLKLNKTRQDIVITFLAILELIKLRMIKVHQSESFGQIWIYRTSPDATEKETLDY